MLMATQQERRSRVASGSRRKRDVTGAGLSGHVDRESAERAAEALAQFEREQRLRPQVRPTPSADAGWAAVADVLREWVPESTYRLWLEPLTCIGEVSGALAVEAPEDTFAWIFRRYGALLGRATREATDHRGVFLFRAAPPSRGDDEGLL
jgi:hypothetical protein